MKAFDSRSYSIADFVEWNENGLLDLSPDFQRRAVWSQKAKSYLIDTIVRGKPIPKILLTQELKARRTLRVVVDGQQRLRAILEFINGDLRISRAHSKELAGCTYHTLPEEMKGDFLKYELGVAVLFDMSYEDILDIFARINSYTVTLVKQEKLNARYLGYFKQFVFGYGFKYVKYFLDGGVLTKTRVNRMAEAELATDLFVALVGGVQTNKNNETYYKKYEDDIGELEECAERFDVVMSHIAQIYKSEEIAQTNWSRIPLFYTLFTVIAHLLYGLEGLSPHLRFHISKRSIGKLRVGLDEISTKYDEVAADMDSETAPKDYVPFIDFSRRRTTDTAARVARAEFLCRKLSEVIG